MGGGGGNEKGPKGTSFFVLLIRVHVVSDKHCDDEKFSVSLSDNVGRLETKKISADVATRFHSAFGFETRDKYTITCIDKMRRNARHF